MTLIAPFMSPPGADVDRPADAAAVASLQRELTELRIAYTGLQRAMAERDAVAERYAYLAHHDALTGLPNRLLLADRLTQALAFARRAGTEITVTYLDLDCFKEINDTLGHAAGDRVLSEVALRLVRCIRSADTASRLGGDEFVLVCYTAGGQCEAAQIAARVLTAIAEPIDVCGTAVSLAASVGMTVSSAGSGEPADLIAAADTAMYAAKAGGGNRFAFASLR